MMQPQEDRHGDEGRLIAERDALILEVNKMKRKSRRFASLSNLGGVLRIIGIWGAVLWIVAIYWFVLLLSVFLTPFNFEASVYERTTSFYTNAILLFSIPLLSLFILAFIGGGITEFSTSKIAKISADINNLQVRIEDIQKRIVHIERLAFEDEQKRKGLIAFVNRFGEEVWGTPSEIAILSKRDFEEGQSERGLVKYGKRWMTPQEMFEAKQKKRGLIKFIDRLGRERYGTPKQVKEWKAWDIDLKNRFQRLKPREFEELVANLFIKMGYNATLSQHVGDYGVDVLAEKGPDRIAIQVKRYAPDNKVGSPDVQKVLGSMFRYNANKAILITTSDFTEAAKEQARNAPIELWNYRILSEKIEKYLLAIEEAPNGTQDSS